MPELDTHGAAALDAALRQPGVQGAAIVLRDGRPGAVRLPRAGDGWSISAMAAASLAAAETAVLELGGGHLDRMLIEAAGCRVLIEGLDDHCLIMMVADLDTPREALSNAATAACQTYQAAP